MKKFLLIVVAAFAAANVEVKAPFRRITYKEAMERFGSDKPDVRFGMELKNISDVVAGTEFVVFKSALENGGSVLLTDYASCGKNWLSERNRITVWMNT